MLYDVVFKVGKNVLTNIQVTAKDEEEAVKVASASFKVGVRKVNPKLITSEDYAKWRKIDN